jgi:hypothetical protein
MWAERETGKEQEKKKERRSRRGWPDGTDSRLPPAVSSRERIEKIQTELNEGRRDKEVSPPRKGFLFFPLFIMRHNPFFLCLPVFPYILELFPLLR